MPKLSEADELLRETRVLEVMSLVKSGRTVTEACEEAGIELRTYQRWKSRVSLKSIQSEIERRKAELAAEVFSAYPVRIAKLIEIATGRDASAKPADIIAAGRDLDTFYAELVSQVEAAESEGSAADEYLSQQPDWLKGPQTKTMRMQDGTQIELTVRPPQVVEQPVVLPEPVAAAEAVPLEHPAPSGPSPDQTGVHHSK